MSGTAQGFAEKNRKAPLPHATPPVLAIAKASCRKQTEMITMSLLVPSRNRSFFNELMHDPFDAFFDFGAPAQKTAPQLMRTDIKETDAGYEMTIDMPGFNKEDVKAQLKNGYLHVTAETKNESEKKDENGAWIRKERFSGTCSRSFYVGEDIQEEDIHAKFENGLLRIDIPKKQPQPKLEEGHSIAIEG